MVIKIKPLEWKEDWGGSLDDIPEWRAETPFSRVTTSVAGMVDGEGHRYERHSDVPEKLRIELQRTAEEHYQMKIKMAILIKGE